MANQWFRLYSEFATDPKIRMMGEALQRRYIMLLCLRCSNDDVTLHDDEITFQLRISNEEWQETKSAFLAKNLIGSDNSPSAWDKRQYRSDSSTERVSMFRNKAKQECNVSVTPPDTDTDTDTDTEVKTKSRGATASRLPDDWFPSDADISFCESERPDLKSNEVASRFRDYWVSQPGQRGRKTNWPATWRNWVRNEKRSAPAYVSTQSRRDIERDEVSAVLCGRQPVSQPRLITGEVVS